MFLITWFFQCPGNVEMGVLILIHNNLWYFLQIILWIVIWLFIVTVGGYIWSNIEVSKKVQFNMIKYVKKEQYAQRFDYCSLLEIVWTVLPSIFLFISGYPGIAFLYSMDDYADSDVYVKVIGRQWYWTYEYPQVGNRFISHKIFDSSLKSDLSLVLIDVNDKWDEIKVDLSYIDTDRTLFLPVDCKVRALVTAADVLHSWAVPSLGIKMDAVPGRINQVDFLIDKLGTYRGQCSEFCGIGHGFMPIKLQAIQPFLFILYKDFGNFN